LSQSNYKAAKNNVDLILGFVDQSSGLRVQVSSVGKVSILQEADGKIFSFDCSEIAEVLTRSDSDKRPFVQINFNNSKKVLLTEALVGFKWGHSSAGRASDLHSEGRRFDPCCLHQASTHFSIKNNSEKSVDGEELESLILAQNKRWRRA
jgi:hypothetical protein